MELLPAVREQFEHYYWARDRQLQACASLTPEQFERPVGGSFPSLRETLAHLVAVEWIWLERWRGQSPKTLIPPSEFPDVAAIAARWRAIESETRAYLATLEEASLACSMSFLSTRGERWTYTLWQMLTHFLLHQSYHRGQITNQFRLLAVEPPRVDFLVGADLGFRG
jgi:uncharacterized damage-inducible protein DinB